MMNYVKSELYKSLRDKKLYIFLVALCIMYAGICMLTAIIKINDPNMPYATTRFVFVNLITTLSIPMFLTFFITNFVFGDEYTNQTMKNTISFGIRRKNIFFGKLIVEILISIISMFILVGVIIGVTYISMEDSGKEYLILFIRAFVGAMPLWLAGMVTFHSLFFNTKNIGTIISFFVCIHLIPEVICNIFGNAFDILKTIRKFLPLGILNNAQYDSKLNFSIMEWDSNVGMLKCWIVGIIFTIIVGFIGYKKFNNKDI